MAGVMQTANSYGITNEQMANGAVGAATLLGGPLAGMAMNAAAKTFVPK